MEQTPGQTVGPFFAFGLEYDGDARLVPPGSPGAIRLHGRVLDGEGRGIPDALVEVWQADAGGHVRPAARFAAPRRPHLHRLGPLRHRPHGHLLVHHARAGPAPAGPTTAGRRTSRWRSSPAG